MKRFFLFLFFIFIFCSISFGQTNTSFRFRRGQTLPATCAKSDVFFQLSDNAFYGCSTVNTWTLLAGAGGAGANTQLSNLSGTVAVNLDLSPGGAQSLGNASFPWLQSFIGNTTQYEQTSQSAGLITHAALGSAGAITIALLPKGAVGVVVGAVSSPLGFAGSLSVAGDIKSEGANGVVVASAASIFWNARAVLQSPVDGQLKVGTNAGTNSFILTAAAATATPNMQLGAAAAAAPVPQILSVQSVVTGTSNTAGANFTIAGSQSTGNVAGGSIIFQTSPLSGSSSTPNALVTALTIAGSGAATFGISVSVGSSSMLTNLITSGGDFKASAAGAFYWLGRSIMRSPADSQMTLLNQAETDFSLLQFGGTTSSFPALKRSTTKLQVRLADDSAYTSLDLLKLTTYNAVATAGLGVPAIYSAGRVTAQSAANASIATYTVGAADGSFEVSANMNVTASTTLVTTLTCTYTDESNTARTMIFPVTQLSGSFIAAGAITGVGAWETPTMHIRCKASTAITILTSTGTFTGVTYTAEGIIKQMS